MPVPKSSVLGASLAEPAAHKEPVLVQVVDKAGEPRIVAYQWYDGAGELHYEALSLELSQAWSLS